jgi:hydroxymethylglutaryl-CoA synthase
MIQVTPKEFVETMQLMETRYGAKDFIPVSSKSTLRPSTFFITQVDALYRRSYDRYQAKLEKLEANGTNGIAH